MSSPNTAHFSYLKVHVVLLSRDDVAVEARGGRAPDVVHLELVLPAADADRDEVLDIKIYRAD